MRTTTAWVILSIALLCLATPAAATEDAVAEERLDGFLRDEMDRLDIPGLAISVVRDGEIVYERGLGSADPSGRNVTPNTPFIVASVSKSITGLAIALLVEDGHVALDDPVQRHIDWFRVDDGAAAEEITVAHLLGHSSGLSERSGLENHADDTTDDAALERNVRRLASGQLSFEPGTAHEYSNANYDVLGYLVQVVSGMPYEEFIEQRIFEPLAMSDSYTNETDAIRGGRATGYYLWFGRYPRPFRPPYPRGSVPSSFVITSAHDLGRLLEALLQEGQLDGERVLPAAAVAMVTGVMYPRDGDSGYAMGWYSNPASTVPEELGLTSIEHDGSSAAYRAFVQMVPEERLGIALTYNASDETRGSRDFRLMDGILPQLLGFDPPAPALREPFLERHVKSIAPAIVALQLLVILVWAALVRSRRGTLQHPLRWALVPLVFDLGLLYLVLVVLPGEFNLPLRVGLRLAPDLEVTVVVIVALATLWPIARFAIALRARSTPAADARWAHR